MEDQVYKVKLDRSKKKKKKRKKKKINNQLHVWVLAGVALVFLELVLIVGYVEVYCSYFSALDDAFYLCKLSFCISCQARFWPNGAHIDFF